LSLSIPQDDCPDGLKDYFDRPAELSLESLFEFEDEREAGYFDSTDDNEENNL
jgi:hypothetical protein